MTANSHIQYRPDIDGLRALAVLSVIVFHINDKWLSGGFLGVDVFFVISGYLITSIIKKQLDENRFSFRVFYTRRIKRILPLLFTVLFVTIIPAMYILLPHDFESFSRSVRYAMQFRANRAFTGSDYFDIFTEEKPLLHLWSLAIEEQFYFMWPFIIFIAYFFTKKWQHQRYILFLLAIGGIVVSTLLAEGSIKNNPADSYYLLQNRVAELLVGCALALNPFRVSQKLKTPFGIVGIIVLVSCFILFSADTPMPGTYALIPTVAAALFILDTNLNTPYKKIFRNPVARTIGLWSFSLYLWHWPLLALPRYLYQDSVLPLSWIFIAVIATFVLSIITYYLIENPVRKTHFKLLPSILLIFIIPYGIVTISYTLAQRYIDTSFLHVDNEITRLFTEQEACYNGILADCAVGDKGAATRYLLIGDSHAMHLSSMMNVIGKQENIKIDIITPPGCQALLTEAGSKVSNKKCAIANQYLFDNLDHYDAVMITQFFAPYIDSEIAIPQYLLHLEETVQFIAQKTPVILISDVPALGFQPLRNDRMQRLNLEPFKVFTDEKRLENMQANDQVKAISEKIENAYFLDILPYIYSLLDQNKLIYYDENHLNPYGSREVGLLFIQDQTLLLQLEDQ